MALGLGLAALALSVPAFAQDSDADAVPNDFDVLPCDADVAGYVFAPSAQGFGMLMFEDLWPSVGDFDFNDLVVTHNLRLGLDGAGRLSRLRLTVDVVAIGAHNDNGLSWRLPVPRSAVRSARLSVAGGSPRSLSVWADETQATFTLAENTRALFGNQTGFLNTEPDNGASVAPVRLVLEVALSSAHAVDTALAPFDLFLSNAVAGSEVHRPEYRGTSRMDSSLVGFHDDGTTASRAFVTRGGIPFALSFPRIVSYARENRAIDRLFPDIIEFGRSLGTSRADFYTRPVSTEAFASTYTPASIPADGPADTSCFPRSGTCGSAHGGAAVNSAPNGNLCSAGTPSSVSAANTAFTWSCAGDNGGSVANCSRDRIRNASCGSAAGRSLRQAPASAERCSVGNASSVVTGASAFDWSCTGINGGSSVSCTAPRTRDGVCGSASGGRFVDAPSANLCGYGTASARTSSGGQWRWSCGGINGGTTASCAAVDMLCTPASTESCSISNGTGRRSCANDGLGWQSCNVVSCDAGYTQSGNQCVRVASCGSVAGTAQSNLSASSSGLCSVGSVASFRLVNGSWSWSCVAGTTVSCSAGSTYSWVTGGYGSCSANPSWSAGSWGSCSASAGTWTTGNYGSCSANPSWSAGSWGSCSASPSWSTGSWGSCSAATPSWSTGSWGSCSANPSWSGYGSCSRVCGGGTQTRSCQNRSGTQNRAVSCNSTSGSQTRSVSCSNTSGSQSRSVSCVNTTGTQSRSVSCVNGTGSQSRSVTCVNTTGSQSRSVSCRRNSDGASVADGLCGGGRPAASRSCTASCSSTNRPSASQSCSRGCSSGTRPSSSRSCTENCSSGSRPSTSRSCTQSCSGGAPSSSRSCTRSCSSSNQPSSSQSCTENCSGSSSRSCNTQTSRSCSITNGSGSQSCNGSGSGYNSCQVTGCNSGYIQDGNSCGVAARCGSAAGSTQTGTSFSGKCAAGSPDSTYGNTSNNTIRWECETSANLVSCSARWRRNGACGSSAGRSYQSAPSSGLCGSGFSSSSVSTGSSSFSWTCYGVNGGSNTSCSATRSPPPGSCSYNGRTYSDGSRISFSSQRCRNGEFTLRALMCCGGSTTWVVEELCGNWQGTPRCPN